ncbi:MAG: AGE family epimerase/isomerase, partial [Clostridia bacterium]|nr:AGE family epimerase/isomerase [Clostridia bacterium]
DEELLAFSKNVFDTAFEFGWDETYGGILYFKDYEGYPVEAYEHDMKLWWPHNEAIIASLKLYKATGNKKYMEVFDRVVDYAFDHFSDFKYGEWYGYLRRDGKPTEPPCKGHTYKGPFHVLRMLTIVIELLREMQ